MDSSARDLLRPAKIETYDLKGDVPALEDFLNTGTLANGDIARDDDNTWTDGSVVDAHVYDGYTYDFYFKQFGRHGLDDHSLAMQFVVHPLLRAEADQFTDDTVQLFINNAAYIGGGQMFLGDGDGTSFTYFAGSLDVVAHEWTHGVTDYSSGLDTATTPARSTRASRTSWGRRRSSFWRSLARPRSRPTG